MSKVVGVLTVILGISLFIADFSLGASDTPQIVRAEQTQNVEPAAQGEDVPIISSAEPLFDFGEVNEGERVEHVFQLQNTGSADLVIKRAAGS